MKSSFLSVLDGRLVNHLQALSLKGLIFLGSLLILTLLLPLKPSQAGTFCFCHNFTLVEDVPVGNDICVGATAFDTSKNSNHYGHFLCNICDASGVCFDEDPANDPIGPGENNLCDDCDPEPSSCQPDDLRGTCAGCGNGILNEGEECDDGDNDSDTDPGEEPDRCDENCMIICAVDDDCPDDGDPCTEAVCEEGGECSTIPLSNVPCDDGMDCTSPDVCMGGVCVGDQEPGPCEDTDPRSCAVPTCEEGPNSETDDPLCGIDDSTCECETSEDCNVAPECTIGSCEDGACVYTFSEAVTCDDGIFCNGAESCVSDGQGGGSCQSAGDPCPAIAEAEENECLRECNEAEQACGSDINTACNDDENECTDDHCNGLFGNDAACVHTNNTNLCDDGFDCTNPDVCVGGVCMGSREPGPCDDTDPRSCAVPICMENPEGNEPQCGIDESTCECATDEDCDDGNPCTTDSCGEDNFCDNPPVDPLVLSPSEEICDQLDNNCNGMVDEGGVCQPTDAGQEGPFPVGETEGSGAICALKPYASETDTLAVFMTWLLLFFALLPLGVTRVLAKNRR